jgi:hypothetical protein
VGGTIGVDHATGIIFVEDQVILGAGKILHSKKSVEQWAKYKIKKYHTNNRISVSK